MLQCQFVKQNVRSYWGKMIRVFTLHHNCLLLLLLWEPSAVRPDFADTLQEVVFSYVSAAPTRRSPAVKAKQVRESDLLRE